MHLLDFLSGTIQLRGGASHISPSLAEGDKGGGFDSTKNAIIIGDNLDALKILKSAYTEKIKMIYIDPPYNTANDNFIYPDNFREDYKAILREVGLIEIDENGEEMESENLRFFKNIQSSRTHSGWLSFMLPRLKLARDLLKEDSVIFISIDDNEQANLKILCDEIFGEDNFVCNFIWKCRTSKQYSSVTASIQTDYILCYGKNKDTLLFNKIWGEKDGLGYKNPDNDPNGAWITSGLIRDDGRKKYKIITPSGKEYYEAWLYTEENMKKFRENGELWFGIDGDAKPRKKSYLKDFEGNITSNLLIGSEIGTNEYGTNEVKSFFKNQPIFKNPKPTKLIKYLLEVVTSVNKNTSKNNNNVASAHCVNNSKESAQGVETPCYQGSGSASKNDNNVAFASASRWEAHCVQSQSKALKVAEPNFNENENNKIINNTETDIILDFFAGSGTTAQAVMELNEEDGGNRQFILVQIDEEIKEEKSKSAYDFCKKRT